MSSARPLPSKQAQNVKQTSQAATTTTTRTVVMGGKPVQVTETEEHIVKKTVWTRVLTGGKKAVSASSWKYPVKALTRVIPHASKEGKDSCGFNLSYYRASYFLLDVRTRLNLYRAGAAPKMTKREVDSLRALDRQVMSDDRGIGPKDREKIQRYKLEAVMYTPHISPSGDEARIRDLVAEAEAAKRRAVAQAAAKKKQNTAANPDSLPAFPTPTNYTKIQIQQPPLPAQPRPQPTPHRLHPSRQQPLQRPPAQPQQQHLQKPPQPQQQSSNRQPQRQSRAYLSPRQSQSQSQFHPQNQTQKHAPHPSQPQPRPQNKRLSQQQQQQQQQQAPPPPLVRVPAPIQMQVQAGAQEQQVPRGLIAQAALQRQEQRRSVLAMGGSGKNTRQSVVVVAGGGGVQGGSRW